MFEDKALADQAVVAVEKAMHHEDMNALTGEPKPIEVGQVELVEKTSDKEPTSKV